MDDKLTPETKQSAGIHELEAVVQDTKYDNVILIRYPQEVTTEFLTRAFTKVYLMSQTITKPVILVNIGSSFKARPTTEQNNIIKDKLAQITNLKHIIFVGKDVPMLVKLSIKFTIGVLHRDKYNIVETIDEAFSLIEKLNSKLS